MKTPRTPLPLLALPLVAASAGLSVPPAGAVTMPPDGGAAALSPFGRQAVTEVEMPRGMGPLAYVMPGETGDGGALDTSAPFYDPEGSEVGQRGFILDDATGVQDMGDLPGGENAAVAHGADTSGHVVGASSAADGRHAVLWEADGLTDLGDLPGGAVEAVARAVSDGTVVGQGTTDEGKRAFIWDAGRGMRDLNEVAGAGDLVLRDATDIDAAGRVVGRAERDGEERAFAWDPERGLQDLGRVTGEAVGSAAMTAARESLGAPEELRFAEALAGELNGAVVGRGAGARPVLWLPGAGVQDLGDLPGGEDAGVARDVNAGLRVVGQSAVEGGDHAFLWTPETGMVDLNDRIEAEGVTLIDAVEVLFDGRILAYGRDGEAVRVYRLTPEGESGAKGQGGPGAGGYALEDLGEYVRSLDETPVLAMTEAGRVVGGCDLLAIDCPYLWNNMGDVTNLLDEDITNFFPGEGAPAGALPPPEAPAPRLVSAGGGGGAPGNGLVSPAPRGGGAVPGGGGGFGGGGGSGSDDSGEGIIDEDDVPDLTGPGPDEGPGTPGGGTPEQPSPVPLPAAGWALLAGLGLLSLRRRG